MSILKIKDAQGHIYEIPTLKGDPGIQGPPGPKGAPGIPGPVGPSGFKATPVTTTENTADDFTTPGLYYFDTTHKLNDAPSQSKIGFLSVIREGHTTKQEWQPSYTNEIYSRRNYDATLSVWREWNQINTFTPLNKSSDLSVAYHKERVNNFVNRMNERAATLNMTSTEYKTPSGYLRISADEQLSTAYNNHTTVEDMMRLLIAARYIPQVFSTMGKHSVNYEVNGTGYILNHNILMNKDWCDWETNNGYTILAAKGGSLTGSYGEIGSNGILNYTMIISDGSSEYAVVILGLENTDSDKALAKILARDLINIVKGSLPSEEISSAANRTSKPVGMGVAYLSGTSYDADITSAMNIGKFYNGSRVYVAASVTKIMTALLVAENADNHFVTISRYDKVGGSGSSHTDTDAQTSVGDLFGAMLVYSDNAAATVLAKDCKVVNGGAKDAVYIAEYDVTTYAEIVAAYNAGKVVKCHRHTDSYEIMYELAQLLPTEARFGCSSNTNVIYYATCKSTDVWAYTSSTLELSTRKTNTITASSTTTQYPSAKAVYDLVTAAVAELKALIMSQ